MLYSIAAILVLILDQAVKYWTVRNIAPQAIDDACVKLIPGVIHMTNVQNYGAAFSIMENARWILVAVSALFIIGIIILVSMDIIHTKFGRWTAVLVMAGALGNCIDRILLGYVVDMFEFELFNFAVFNVADIFITVCGILFCLHVIIYREPEAERNAVPRPVKQSKSRKKNKRAPEPEEDEYLDDYEDEEDIPAPKRARATGGRQNAESDFAAAPAPVPRSRGKKDLAKSLRFPDPNDPFSEWDDSSSDDYEDEEDIPAPKRARAPASAGARSAARRNQPAQEEKPAARRRAAVTLDEDDWGDFSPDIPVRQAAPAPAPTPARRASAPAAAPAKPAKPAPTQVSADFDEYSLEDILSEFRDL